MQRVNIEPWQMLHVIWFGCEIFLVSFIFCLHLLWDYIVITRQLYTPQTILSWVHQAHQGGLPRRWIFILSIKRLWRTRSLRLDMFLLLISKQIYWQNPPGVSHVQFICDKRGMYDVYPQAWERELGNKKTWRMFLCKKTSLYINMRRDPIDVTL